MRVLTTRDGDLAAVFGPLCDNPQCCGRRAVGVDSVHPFADVTVADRDDISPDDLRDAYILQLLHTTGWIDVDDVAADMAEEAAEVAAQHPVGTRLEPRYDDADRWHYATR